MSSFQEVDELLNRFDEIQSLVSIRIQKVYRFLFKLQDRLNSYHHEENILKNCNFIPVGSAAEETAVRDNVDFDVILSLPQPYTLDNFEVRDVDKYGVMGVYKLRKSQYDNDECSYSSWNHNSSSCSSMSFDGYVNRNGYLKVGQLKEDIFDVLEHAVQMISLDEPYVSYVFKRKNSSFCITVQSRSSSAFKIDLIPQIKGSQQDFFEDWSHDVPYVVKHYIRSNINHHMHFNLSFPFWMHEESYQHLAVYATFSQLESHCMSASGSVRDAVRLTKAVSKHYGWVEKGLQSFHIKRAAIAMFDTLKNMDPWYGHRAILSELRIQLKSGGICGVFLRNHNIALKDTNTCLQMADEITLAKQNICPSNILKKLTVYV